MQSTPVHGSTEEKGSKTHFQMKTQTVRAGAGRRIVLCWGPCEPSQGHRCSGTYCGMILEVDIL